MALEQDPSAPESRQVRFHPPESGTSGEARIPFDIGGLAAGELRELANRGGSRWIVSSMDAELQGITIGREEALALGPLRQLVEEAADRGAGPDRALAGAEERRRLGREAPPASPVRFRPPACGRGMGYAEVGVEIGGRLVGHLREVPADPRDGSQWIMYSRQPELDRIGTGEPSGLGKACREVEAAVRSHPHFRTSAADRARAAATEARAPERCR